MVAYGVPVIHQSLATAPLDIKEAIDWLIRIGGKDVKEKDTKCSELIQVLKEIVKAECKVAGEAISVSSLEANVEAFVKELAKFVGYDSSGGSSKHRQDVDVSGIGRRGGQSILNDLHTGGFLTCCKDESVCTPRCKCCQGDAEGGVMCNPQKCPIQKLLDCSIPQKVINSSFVSLPHHSSINYKMCCIVSFLIACFEEGVELSNSPVKCKRCDGSNFHEACHKDCKCQHKSVISKVSCRMNCLIQLATTITTLYINRNFPICRTCQNCNVCNPPRESNKCQPCTECGDASQGNGKHCDLCRTGQCCEVNNARNKTCKSNCERCQNCSTVRNSKAFWDMLDHVLYTCAKCSTCRSTSSPQARGNCPVCNVCPGASCVDGCKNRKRFGNLILELLHFMANNFGDVASALKGNLSRLKDGCCKQRGKKQECTCNEACCGSLTSGPSDCEDCKLYCICCVEKGEGCNCANQCSERLESLLRPALSGYVSAYDYNIATWDTLCKKEKGKNTCSDQCNAECNCATPDCPDEGCCSHCPKRQCAKIFCLVVPAIYSFLNYVKKHITDELRDGSGNPTSQWASALIDGDTQLGDLFRTCGFASSRLKPRMGCELLQAGHVTSSSSCRSKGHKPGNLIELLESCGMVKSGIAQALILSNIHTLNYSNPVMPITIRDKLLWLSGLPYSNVYEELQQRLKDSMPKGISSLSIMELALRLCVIPFHVIEDSSQCIWEYITRGFNVPGTKHSLYYNRDPVRLLWDLYDVVYAVTCAMIFLNKQCSVSSINSGWEDCKFGKRVSLNGDNIDACKCQTGNCSADCSHCRKVCNACRGAAKCVCCCPHCEQRPDRCTCLMRFVINDGASPDPYTASPYSNAGYGPMGFRTKCLRKVEMTGATLYDCLSALLTDDHAVFSRLLEKLIIARAGVPDNLSDYYSLFLGLGMRLQMESNHKGVMDRKLVAAFKTIMRDTFFGARDGIMEPVVSAVRKLYKEESGHSSNGSGITDASTHNASDLMSLYGCYSGVGCVGYMYALPSGPYELFSRYPDTMVAESAGLFIKWVFCGATSLYNLMRHLRAEVHMLECCKERSSCTCDSVVGNRCLCNTCNCFCQEISSGCSCGTIIKCRKVHPLLYQFGFTFHEPDMWSSHKKKCKDFSDALHRFIGPDSMLCRLIEAIENFLWHIRMPFCIAFLTLWSTSFCFLMYVLIGYLDRVGIRSRWLSPKSFAHPLQFVMNTKVKPMGSGVGVI